MFLSRKQKIKKYEPSAPPPKSSRVSNGMDQKQSYCLGGRHKFETIDVIEYEKKNHKTNKIVEVRKEKHVIIVDVVGHKFLPSK